TAPGDRHEVLAYRQLLGIPRQPQLRQHRLRRRRPVHRHLGVLRRAVEDTPDRGALERHDRRRLNRPRVAAEIESLVWSTAATPGYIARTSSRNRASAICARLCSPVWSEWRR